jgi:hypothetical protein
VDEPFLCSQPVYSISIDENEPKAKSIFTIGLIDFEANGHMRDYAAQIVAGNSQGLFSTTGLTIYTTGRKLDREARDQHILDLKIVDRTSNATRFAVCRIKINVNDLNDNRPIVNDIELNMYDRLDRLDIPVTNAIAIDQDLVAKLSYSIVSVRDLEDESTNLDSLFMMNTTTGNLYATQTQLPCFECTLQVRLIY